MTDPEASRLGNCRCKDRWQVDMARFVAWAYGIGRNIQMAAGSTELARTATSRRSISGTKSEVRAPDNKGDSSIPPFLLFQNINEASPATDVDACALSVDEQVIGIAAGSVVAIGLPSVMEKTPRSAGARKITRIWRRAGSRAIGKLALRSANGHFPICFCETRSTTAMPRASGTLTKIWRLSGSIWKLSGWAFSPKISQV
jgi:hypothetical protein